MPWCDDCSRFYNPNTLDAEGVCPSCGAKLDVPHRHVRRAGAAGDPRAVEEVDDERSPVPWHFWILVVALVIYLGYRAFQGIVWVAHKL